MSRAYGEWGAERVRGVIEQIIAIEPAEQRGGMVWVSGEQAEQIAALFDGDSALFLHLDSQPGLFGDADEWHFKLRQARNHPAGAFMARLGEDAQRLARAAG